MENNYFQTTECYRTPANVQVKRSDNRLSRLESSAITQESISYSGSDSSTDHFNSKRNPSESHVVCSWRATSQTCQALREPPGSTRFPWVGGAIGSGWECETLSPASAEHMVHGRMHATPLLINHMSTGGLALPFQALCLCRWWQHHHKASLGLSLSIKPVFHKNISHYMSVFSSL